jgi:hypothetical protein
MQLIQDTFIIENLQVLNEGASTGPMRIKGVFGRCNEKNNNGRIYPTNILESQLSKVQPLIEERRLCGELDHPQNDTVKLSNASHLITKLEMKGNELIGEAELLRTPAGLTAQALINGGVKIGISSRGMGTLSEDREGNKIVNEDFRLVTFDLVADPSTRGAFPGLSESTESRFIMETQNKLEKECNFVTLMEAKLRNAYGIDEEDINLMTDDPKIALHKELGSMAGAAVKGAGRGTVRGVKTAVKVGTGVHRVTSGVKAKKQAVADKAEAEAKKAAEKAAAEAKKAQKQAEAKKAAEAKEAQKKAAAEAKKAAEKAAEKAAANKAAKNKKRNQIAAEKRGRHEDSKAAKAGLNQRAASLKDPNAEYKSNLPGPKGKLPERTKYKQIGLVLAEAFGLLEGCAGKKRTHTKNKKK